MPATTSPNQLVAYNLRRARLRHGWTQAEAAERLEPFLGTRWSTASYSAAERSAETERRRHFDANELYAFSRAFELPLSFFLASAPWSETIAPDGAAKTTSREDGLDLCFAPPPVDALIGRDGILELSAWTTDALKRWRDEWAAITAERQREVDALFKTREDG